MCNWLLPLQEDEGEPHATFLTYNSTLYIGSLASKNDVTDDGFSENKALGKRNPRNQPGGDSIFRTQEKPEVC